MKSKGVWLAIGAYASWGLFPLYWKLLKHIPAMQLIGHRIVWSFLSMLVFVVAVRQWKTFWQASASWRVIGIYLLASLLIGVNWLTYVWAVNAGHVVETSLGYFINPLLSVLLGVVFFRERLRTWQWVAVLLTTAGVLYLTLAVGRLPWIALTLAFSFALYGLMKKIAPLNPLYGLSLETGLLTAPAIIYLLMTEKNGTGAFMHDDLLSTLLMIGSGIVTTIPLLMFASAAKRIPLSLIGILQYIAPTLQFLIGILVYHEAFTHVQLLGYGAVWMALLLFGFESFWVYRLQYIAVRNK